MTSESTVLPTRRPTHWALVMSDLEARGFTSIEQSATDSLGAGFFARPPRGSAVSYLRVVDLPELDLEAAWQEASRRRSSGAHRRLLADDIGQVTGHIYAQFHPAPVFDLARLVAASRRQGAPLPVDAALEIALGLADLLAPDEHEGAHAQAHGFIVPELVLLSARGAVRVAGFEFGGALAGAVADGPSRDEFAPYVSPEVLHGHPPQARDDVYALGAILALLVTGGPPGEERGLVPDRLLDGRLMPDKLAGLFRWSLASETRKPRDVAEWKRRLEGFIFDQHYRASPDSLGFLVESLCAKEIEDGHEGLGITQGSRAELRATSDRKRREEVEALFAVEDRNLLPPTAGALPGEVVSPTNLYEARADRERKRPLFKAAVLAAIVAVAVLGVALWPSGSETAEPTSLAEALATAASPDAPMLQPASPAVGSEPAVNDPQDSPAISAATELPIVAPDRGGASGQSGALPSPIDQGREATSAASEESAVDLQAAVEPRDSTADVAPATPANVASGSPQSPPAEAQPRMLAATRRGEIRQPVLPQQPHEAPGEAPAAPASATASVELDEMGAPASEEIPPELLRSVKPELPKRARRLNKQFTIRVRVLVDTDGNVVEAILDSEPVGYRLDEAVLDAARKFFYRPATRDGAPVKAWATITFSFKLR